MNKIETIARLIVTALIGVPFMVAVIALVGIWYLSGGFIIYLTYLCVDTINTIFGGNTEEFWNSKYGSWEPIRRNMVDAINIWFK